MNELNRIRIEALRKFVGPSSEASLDKTITGVKAVSEAGETTEIESWQDTLRCYKETERTAAEISKTYGYQAARAHYMRAIELADRLSANSQRDQDSVKQSLKVLSTGLMSDGTTLSELHEQILHAATVQTIRNCQYSSEVRISWGKVLLKGQKFFEAAEMFHAAEMVSDKINAFLVKAEIALLIACSKRSTTKASLAVAYLKASERISLDKSSATQGSPLSGKAWTNFRGNGIAKDIYSGRN